MTDPTPSLADARALFVSALYAKNNIATAIEVYEAALLAEARKDQPAAPSGGVFDSRCPYMATAGFLCSKCGRIHDGKNVNPFVPAAPSPEPVTDHRSDEDEIVDIPPILVSPLVEIGKDLGLICKRCSNGIKRCACPEAHPQSAEHRGGAGVARSVVDSARNTTVAEERAHDSRRVGGVESATGSRMGAHPASSPEHDAPRVEPAPLCEEAREWRERAESASFSSEFGAYSAVLDEAAAAWSAEKRRADLEMHKVITCGVAAHHPDPELTRKKKCYAQDWNSPQADDVRKLRAERDAAVRERDELRERLRVPCKGCPGCSSDDCPDAADLVVSLRIRLAAAEKERDELQRELLDIRSLFVNSTGDLTTKVRDLLKQHDEHVIGKAREGKP